MCELSESQEVSCTRSQADLFREMAFNVLEDELLKKVGAGTAQDEMALSTMENGLPNIGAPSDMMDAGATYKERINVEDTHDTQTNLFNDKSPNGGDDMVDGGHSVGEDGHLEVDSVHLFDGGL